MAPGRECHDVRDGDGIDVIFLEMQFSMRRERSGDLIARVLDLLKKVFEKQLS
jgi:hypothetical protein